MRTILDTIGNTPLVRLQRLTQDAELYAKLEYFNPGGSVKDRIGLSLIEDAECSGRLQPGGTVIEPTAGNTGIGLALVAVQKGYRCICVVPTNFSVEKQALMRAMGAEVVNTPEALGMAGALAEAERLHESIPGSVIPQQFANPANTLAHYRTTGPEIFRQMEGRLDAVAMGGGTLGTFMGAVRYLKEQLPNLHAAFVEPEGSVIGGGPSGLHKVEGIGVSDISFAKLLDRSLIDEVIMVTDREAHRMMARLAQEEGVLAGSSGACATVGALRLAGRMRGARIVTLIPDSSERYLSQNPYGRFEEWKR